MEVYGGQQAIYEGSDVKKVAPVKKEIKKAAPLEKGEEGFKGKVVYRYDKKAKKPKRLPMMISKCSSGAMYIAMITGATS